MSYVSMYSSPEKKSITAAQYLAELVCFNNASKNNQELPLNFWKVPHWKPYYIVQIKRANGLLERFDEAVLIKFVREKRIWSLSAKWIIQALEMVSNDTPDQEFEKIKAKDNPTFSKKQPINIDFLDG